ncbi:MAG TPA: hypothetical protein VNA15_03235 [Candidatus Angelobacter sp.]|nr:hypothetical protein [Candidatus Angelobacter sp.]
MQSSRLKKAGMMTAAGYTIYVTNRRIIGAKSRKALGKAMLGSALGGAYMGGRLFRDHKVQMSTDLEGKDFEVKRGTVTGLELKKPSFFSRGHFVVNQMSGDPIKILIADKKDFRRIMELMQAFRPDAVQVV